MNRKIALLSMAMWFVFSTSWVALAPGAVGAADLFQSSFGDVPPEVERFDYLFEAPSPSDAEGKAPTNDGDGTIADAGSDAHEASEPATSQEGTVVSIVPYYPDPDGLSVRVDRGCGSLYNVGEFLTISVYMPSSGDLTIWSSSDGEPWHRMRGPVWVQPSTIPISNAYIEPPAGNQLLFARLNTSDGRVLEDVCHYFSDQGTALPTMEPTTSFIAPPPPTPDLVEPEPVPQPAPDLVEPEPVPQPTPDLVEPDPVPQPAPTPVDSEPESMPLAPESVDSIPLECDADVPPEMPSGASFRQHISVTNPANSATATEVVFYARISPAGHLPVYSCSPDCNVSTGLATVALGTLQPGETRIVTFDGYGPALPGGRFDLSYSTSSAELAEYSCAQASFTVGDQILGFEAP